MLGFNGGAIGADVHCDRTGIHGRTLVDCATILDALKDADNGYYDARDPFTTVPRSSVIDGSYASFAVMPGNAGALAGTRIGVIRESMIYPKGSKTEQPIVSASAREIKEVLGKKLGATLVESRHVLWERDPDLEVMTLDYSGALARLIPLIMPDILFRLDNEGQPLFMDFADTIVPTEFSPGKIFGKGTM
jgi:amidase